MQAFSVWEIAMLESRGCIDMHMPIHAWMAGALALPGLALIGLDPNIAIESTRLPGALHADPADRVLAATARIHGLTLVTRDAALLEYAGWGHLRALAA